MHRPRLAVLTALALSPLVLSACGSDDASSAGAASGATVVKISVTDDGCVPSPATAAAGPLEFQVVNTGANRVTEAEVLQDGKILGEKENLTPGLSGSFTLRLTAGDYVVACPNAATDQSAFQVTGAAASTTANADLSKSVETYQAYLENQAKGLTASTTKFVAAVQAGDVQRAKALFAPTRAYYERIEPVAESLRRPRPADRRPRERRRRHRHLDGVPPHREGALAGRLDEGPRRRRRPACSPT
ncbi:hypothetical protein GCM10025868_35770 [Angustibacter aerolatus]|uniref:Lipoprotein n=1 Tax=Angustibacter aerolatus TaxID=1162965 RepID=A0ABQ6JKL8_9ACTN|nr:hypothetical protein GCM10025868_35770 [Angustibacter aerolatus]